MSKVANYIDAVKPNLEFLKTSIKNSSSGEIVIKAEDFAKAMEMTKESFMSIFWDIRWTLFQDGIVVRTGKLKESDKMALIMRNKMEGDTFENIEISKERSKLEEIRNSEDYKKLEEIEGRNGKTFLLKVFDTYGDNIPHPEDEYPELYEE